MANNTNVSVPNEIHQKLTELKSSQWEPYSSVISKLIKAYEENVKPKEKAQQ